MLVTLGLDMTEKQWSAAALDLLVILTRFHLEIYTVSAWLC